MDNFLSRKRPREPSEEPVPLPKTDEVEEESTDFKLAVLSSLYPGTDTDTLLEALLIAEGSVENASEALKQRHSNASPKKRVGGPSHQSSLASYAISSNSGGKPAKRLTKKGRTLHLYSPEDIEAHTPCTLIYNFLPAEEADALLMELVEESHTFQRASFKLFENVVQSPHSMGFYVADEETRMKRTDYVYNGNYMADVRKSPPKLLEVSLKVQEAVNKEINRRIETVYPDGKKLRYQSSKEWKPNAAFVNCYDGGAESVGYHSDQLTYLGPHPVIGSLSLGVAREFRVRHIVARDGDDGASDAENASSSTKAKKREDERADAQGQISIHLPHNSLLVMHAEMQEEWKHSIAPAQAIDPHPIAKNKRINITYRYYRESLHPSLTPRCKCNIPTVLRCVQRRKENRGRYMWMCHANFTPGKEGCSFFQWAEFDDDGEPPWATNMATRSESNPLTEETDAVANDVA